MLGEEVDDATNEEYKAYMTSGDLMTVSYHGKNVYAVSPKFFSSFNNFRTSKAIVYGGFCFSFLGGWPDAVNVTAGAKVYTGFTWWVYTDWNAKWGVSLFNNLSWKRPNGPMNVETWFTSPKDPKPPVIYDHSYFQTEDNHTCSIQYTGTADYCLWYGVKIEQISPSTGVSGDEITITGLGFGTTKGTSKLFYGSNEIATTSWSNTSIKAKVPASAVSDSIYVNLKTSFFDLYSNKVYFSIKSDKWEIRSISPAYEYFDRGITIRGYFGKSTTDSMVVKVNDYAAKGYFYNDTTVVLILRKGMPTGIVKISFVRNSITSNEYDYFIGLPASVLNTYKFWINMSIMIKGTTASGGQTSGFFWGSTIYGVTENVTWSGYNFTVNDTVRKFTITGNFSADGQTIENFIYNYYGSSLSPSEFHIKFTNIPRYNTSSPWGILRSFEASGATSFNVSEVSGYYGSNADKVTITGVNLTYGNYLRPELTN